VQQAVDQRVLLGDLNGIVERKDAHQDAQPQSASAFSGGRKEHRWRRTNASVVKMVLGNPQGRQARRFAALGKAEHLLISVASCRNLGRERINDREGAQFHAALR
jgi:hypothetical protein